MKVSEGKAKGGKQCKAMVEKEVGKTGRKKQAGKIGSEKKSTVKSSNRQGEKQPEPETPGKKEWKRTEVKARGGSQSREKKEEKGGT